jgi:hypothetical protein
MKDDMLGWKFSDSGEMAKESISAWPLSGRFSELFIMI